MPSALAGGANLNVERPMRLLNKWSGAVLLLVVSGGARAFVTPTPVG